LTEREINDNILAAFALQKRHFGAARDAANLYRREETKMYFKDALQAVIAGDFIEVTYSNEKWTARSASPEPTRAISVEGSAEVAPEAVARAIAGQLAANGRDVPTAFVVGVGAYGDLVVFHRARLFTTVVTS